MKDADKTKAQLTEELETLRQRVADLEVSDAERERAKDALRESEERERALFEQLLVSVVVIDAETQSIVDFNESAARNLGYSREEFGKLRLSDIEALESSNDIREHVKAILAKGSDSFETQHKTKNGEIRDVHVSVKAVRLGGRDRFVAIWRDITERKQAEEELAWGEWFHRTAIEAAGAVPYCRDYKKNRYEFVGPGIEKLIGYSANEFTPELWDEIIQEIVPTGEYAGMTYSEAMDKARVERRSAWSGDYRVRTKSGEDRWLACAAADGRDKEGTPVESVGMFVDITERKQTEGAITRAREEWERTFDAVPDLIAIVDKQHRIVRVNKPMADRLGLTPKECIGQTCYEAVHGADSPPWYCPHAELLSDGQSHEAEVYEERLGGDFLMSVSPLFDAQGKLTGSVHVARDITERKEAEAEAQLFQYLINRSNDAVFVIDPQTSRFLQVNEKACDSLGYGCEDLLKMGVVDIETAIPDRPSWQEHIKEVRSRGHRLLEGEHRRRDGTTFPVEVSVSVVAQGDKEYVVAVARDITDRKNADQQLAESERRYRTLFLDSPGAKSLTESGKIIDVNPAWLRLHGFEKIEDVIGMDVLDVVHPDDRHILEERRGIPRKKLDEGYEIRDVRTDGEVVDVQVYSRSISLHGQPVIITTLHDITERKRADAARKKLQDQLLQAQKMEAVGQLAGGVAHDFNNLLTTIQGFTDLVMMDMDEEAPLLKDMQRIKTASTRAADLVRQLLLFSRKQPMEFMALDINSTISGLLKMLSRLIGEDIEIATDLADDMPSIMGDAGNIEQVVMNLSVNARDAMPHGGTLIIRTQEVALNEERSSRMPEARPGHFVCVSVEDTGEGMDAETIKHVFEPFFTTKGPGKGTGLGLSVVYGIVKKHGGWIDIRSEPGRGSAFTVYFPAVSDTAVQRTNDGTEAQPARGGGERILLVEDEDAVREVARRILTENGYVVFTASNKRDAQDMFEQQKEDVDLIFTDVVLPDGDGIGLVGELSARKPGVKMLLASGYADQKSQWPLIQSRGYPFINKPYSIPDLLAAVRKALLSSAEGA